MPGAQYSSVTLGLWPASSRWRAHARLRRRLILSYYILCSSHTGGDGRPYKIGGMYCRPRPGPASLAPVGQFTISRPENSFRYVAGCDHGSYHKVPGVRRGGCPHRPRADGTSAPTDRGRPARCVNLMMEQPDPGKRHDHAILVGGGNDLVVTDGTAGLGDVLHAGLPGALHVVAKGEEGVGATVTPDIWAIQAAFSSAVSTSGFTLKVFCHTPSASTSSCSSEI